MMKHACEEQQKKLAEEKARYDVEGFLRQYAALCVKYQIVIGGCGCCDSPFLSRLVDGVEDLDEKLRHLRKTW